jgi:hypothetical protein
MIVDLLIDNWAQKIPLNSLRNVHMETLGALAYLHGLRLESGK